MVSSKFGKKIVNMNKEGSIIPDISYTPKKSDIEEKSEGISPVYKLRKKFPPPHELTKKRLPLE